MHVFSFAIISRQFCLLIFFPIYLRQRSSHWYIPYWLSHQLPFAQHPNETGMGLKITNRCKDEHREERIQREELYKSKEPQEKRVQFYLRAKSYIGSCQFYNVVLRTQTQPRYTRPLCFSSLRLFLKSQGLQAKKSLPLKSRNCSEVNTESLRTTRPNSLVNSELRLINSLPVVPSLSAAHCHKIMYISKARMEISNRFFSSFTLALIHFLPVPWEVSFPLSFSFLIIFPCNYFFCYCVNIYLISLFLFYHLSLPISCFM